MPAPAGTTLIDQVDGENRPIGLVRRGEVFDQRANFRTVNVFLTNESGELLLQRLALTRDRHPGQWGSSVAGYLFAGESYSAAASRRLREELDVDVELASCGVIPIDDEGVIKFVGVFSGRAEQARITDPEHVAAIEFRPVAAIEADLEVGLSTYTDTFARVFPYWRHHHSE
ncbi:MAG: NUDIX hydrolase [Jatrophihabitans sp.]